MSETADSAKQLLANIVQLLVLEDVSDECLIPARNAINRVITELQAPTEEFARRELSAIGLEEPCIGEAAPVLLTMLTRKPEEQEITEAARRVGRYAQLYESTSRLQFDHDAFQRFLEEHRSRGLSEESTLRTLIEELDSMKSQLKACEGGG